MEWSSVSPPAPEMATDPRFPPSKVRVPDLCERRIRPVETEIDPPFVKCATTDGLVVPPMPLLKKGASVSLDTSNV